LNGADRFSVSEDTQVVHVCHLPLCLYISFAEAGTEKVAVGYGRLSTTMRDS